MTLDNFRLSKNREEILNVLNKKLQDQSRFILWQKNPENNQREFIMEADFTSLDMVDGIFTIHLCNDMKSNFNRNAETYFLLKGEDFAFKTKPAIVQPQNPQAITFQSPKEVRLVELRNHPRVYFEETDFKNVEVSFSPKSESGHNINTVCRVFNISKGGVCLIITKETLGKINLQQDVEISGLGFFENLDHKKIAVVRNARVYAKKTIKSDELYAIGLEFKRVV